MTKAIVRSIFSFILSIFIVAFASAFFDKADESFWEPALALVWMTVMIGVMLLLNHDSIWEI